MGEEHHDKATYRKSLDELTPQDLANAMRAHGLSATPEQLAQAQTIVAALDADMRPFGLSVIERHTVFLGLFLATRILDVRFGRAADIPFEPFAEMSLVSVLVAYRRTFSVCDNGDVVVEPSRRVVVAAGDKAKRLAYVESAALTLLSAAFRNSAAMTDLSHRDRGDYARRSSFFLQGIQLACLLADVRDDAPVSGPGVLWTFPIYATRAVATAIELFKTPFVIEEADGEMRLARKTA